MEWQPIETAPRDGTEIVGVFVNDNDAPHAKIEGWTGNKCDSCKGHGVRMQDGEERRCPDCAGTGDEYGPKLPPDDFFDDKFDKPAETDTPLQAAAREAGWALSNLVDEIKFEKRQHVVNVINSLSAALSYSERHVECRLCGGDRLRYEFDPLGCSCENGEDR